MLLYHIKSSCCGLFLFILFTVACAGYAYRLNARRPADDPKKQDYPPFAILLAPITLPLFIILYIVLFILRALLYAAALVLFTVALILVREAFILVWLKKIMISLGNIFLEANTILIKLFLKPGAEQPGTSKSPQSVNALLGRLI